MARKFGKKEYGFVPKSYILPKEKESLRANMLAYLNNRKLISESFEKVSLAPFSILGIFPHEKFRTFITCLRFLLLFPQPFDDL